MTVTGVRPVEELGPRCDSCGASKPLKGWHLLELWSPKNATAHQVRTWQLCDACAKHIAPKKKRTRR